MDEAGIVWFTAPVIRAVAVGTVGSGSLVAVRQGVGDIGGGIG